MMITGYKSEMIITTKLILNGSVVTDHGMLEPNTKKKLLNLTAKTH